MAIRVDNICDLNGNACPRGSNPFDNLAFLIDGDRLWFKEYMKTGWAYARDTQSMPLADVAYSLGEMNHDTLACLFPIYDWEADEGFRNLGNWIEDAAEHAGK